MTSIKLEDLDAVNRSQISEMSKAGRTLHPGRSDSVIQFAKLVKNMEAAIRHTYQLTAHAAIREPDPSKAANLWQEMEELCKSALSEIKALKEVYPQSGTPDLYNLTLDYLLAAQQRRAQNVEDVECLKTPVPKGLFQAKS
jgi:hypothetical protein